MNEEHKAFVDAIKGVVGELEPTKEQVDTCNTTEKFYMNLHDGKVHKCVTATMMLYIAEVLPELSTHQAMELNATVHTLIQTVLTYLVEDGLIKEE